MSAANERPHERLLKLVALGGGHGLASSLRACRRLTSDVTAVVTVADDGGSSGRLRAELGILPPGDLRMALAALCNDDEWGSTWADVLQHRFAGGGPLHDHALGNLLIAAVWDRLDDHVAGLELVGRLLGAQGRVLPMATVPIDIQASVRGVRHERPDDLTVVTGQVAVATTPGDVVDVRLVPRDPPACPESVEAVKAADAIVLGPGSWFTSVLPHLLLPTLAHAIATTSAVRIVVLNLAPQAGETDGFSPQQHLDVLRRYAPDLRIDAVIADPGSTPDPTGLSAAVSELGGSLVLAEVARGSGEDQHDAARLAVAIRTALDVCAGRGRMPPWR